MSAVKDHLLVCVCVLDQRGGDVGGWGIFFNMFRKYQVHLLLHNQETDCYHGSGFYTISST